MRNNSLYASSYNAYRHAPSSYPYNPIKPTRQAPIQKWAEDIECVQTGSTASKGSIYISNVEAAENPITLNSTPLVMQNTTSRQ